jgi:SulP family sulfate permease
MAAKTGQRLDPNQELIGQGLANILGAIGRSYPVSGSFSRSAVNLGAGAVTGMSSVFTSLVVVATLLFFTPLLYHIPQSVLAAVIMMAVVGLINVKGFVHTYRAQRYDGVIAVITFFCTLAFAPELDRGIMIGVVLSIGHYLYRNSRPSLAALSLHPDRSLRDAQRHGLQECKNIAVVRFEGPLFFANTSYLEDQINEHIKGKPELRHILLPANGINEIDASGEEALSLIVEQIRERGLEISLSGLNENVLDLMKRTHLLEKIGEDHIFPTMMVALKSIHARAHVGSTEEECPLLKVTFLHPDMFEVGKPVLRDFRVLFLSRDEEHAKGLIKSLRRKGIDVALSVDPEVALRMMRNRFHEVVVMDTVAEPNEEVLLREFCSDWPEAQLIVLGGTESADVAFKLGQCGAYEYLQRDCAVEDLVKTINRAVYDARMRDAERG